MAVEINRHLNLVIPVDRQDGSRVHVHSAPISRDIFEANFEVLGKSFTALMAGGFGAQAGPGVALLMLKKIAKQENQEQQVINGLIPEIQRLTNVIVPGKGVIPLEEAFAAKYIDGDDKAEVENELAFFTVISSAAPRKDIPAMLAFMAHVWNAEITSLNCTEYERSLTTLKKDESSGAKATA